MLSCFYEKTTVEYMTSVRVGYCERCTYEEGSEKYVQPIDCDDGSPIGDSKELETIEKDAEIHDDIEDGMSHEIVNKELEACSPSSGG